MSLLFPFRPFVKTFKYWSLVDGVRVILLKSLAKVRLFTNSSFLIEDANYKEVEEGGYELVNQGNEMVIRHKNWNLENVLIRRYTSDFKVFRQIFLRNELCDLVEFIGSEKIETVIDAGANVGLATLLLKNTYPKIRVICIEPDNGNFTALQKNITSNSLNAVAVQSAIWSKPTRLYFERSFRDGSEWSVTVTEKANDGEYIEATSFNEITERFDMKQIDLLKIDIEGSEKEVFTGGEASLDFLSFTKFIAVEIHEEAVRPEEIERLLRAKGFDLAKSGEYLIGRNTQYIKRLKEQAA